MIDALLGQLARDPAADIDVAEVALYLATDEYPDLSVPEYLARLDELAGQARLLLAGRLRRQTLRLARFLFDDEGFRGNRAEYYDPRNSYLNDVLDRKLGIPITLSVLAIGVGRRIGLDVVGVGLPGHFIAKAIAGDEEVLFDPFHGGQLLTPAGCEQLVQKVTGRPFAVTVESLTPTPPGLIVMRMLNNLRSIYASAEDYGRTARALSRQLQLAPDDAGLRRDLGVTLVRGGRPGAAIDHLKAYIAAAPYADDAVDVRELLARALSDVARWN